jgi:membrane protein
VEPKTEHEEPPPAEPEARGLAKRDYFGIVRRAAQKSLKDHITNLAAALAYYAFLAIPSTLLVAVGIFTLVADADTVETLVDELDKILPAEAVGLIDDS